MTKKISLEDIDLEVLEAALKIIQDKKGKTKHLGEAKVEATVVCLLCDHTEIREFMAKEVMHISSIGEVKWVTLIDDKDQPIYNGTYSYTTHRTHCTKCINRLQTLKKKELAELAVVLSRASMWAAQRAGKALSRADEEVTYGVTRDEAEGS